MGLVPTTFLACYELPRGFISPEPQRLLQNFRAMTADAARLVATYGKDPRRLLLIGLSLGSAPATYLANRFGGLLLSVASADRGDLMLWQSPATAIERQRAMQAGFTLGDFTSQMQGCHPVENLGSLAAGSTFVIGLHDEIVPRARRQALSAAVDQGGDQLHIHELAASHVRTLFLSASLQRELHNRVMLGARTHRSYFAMRGKAGRSD